MDKNAMDNMVKKQFESAEASKRLNQSKAVPRPYRNPAIEVMQWHMKSLNSDMQEERDGYIQTKTTILTGDSHSCKTPFEQLKSIKLCDMKVPMVHAGRYLICKVIGKPCAIVGVNILIEDLNGDVEELGIYNYRYNTDDIEWISIGSIFIIKEPWLRYGAQSKIPSMRVDSPTDLIFVDPADEKLIDKIGAKKWYKPASKDAEVWREKANQCFKKGQYEKALFLYNRGIRCNPDLAVLHLNKSLTCLRMGAYYAAYEAAKLGLEKGGDKQKSLYRMGQAAYGMREWQKAANHFLEVLKEFPQNPDASKELKRATARLTEQKTGKYNFKEMYLESKKGESNIDVADYKGPVEVANIPGKGRGIIASEDIKEGTLLVVSKAFGSGYSKDFSGILFSLNFIRKDAGTADQFLQVINTMQMLQNNPHRAKEVYDLYAGHTVTNEDIPFGVVDAARIQLISAYNRFASDDMNEDLQLSSVEKLTNKADNAHLFILPSYFNHSCLANGVRIFYGDVMVIHAAENIKKGEEICLSYFSPLTRYSERQNKTFGWKFTCKCKLCEIDAADPFCSKRDRIFKEFSQYEKANKNSQNIITKGEQALKKIRETYTKRKELKIVLAQMLPLLSKHYYAVGNVSKSVKYLEECLTLMTNNPLKYPLSIHDICVNLGACYLSIGNNEKFKEMIQKAMELCFTSDMDYFKLLYPDIAHHLNQYFL